MVEVRHLVNRKLTDAQALEIRGLLAAGNLNHREIGDLFGVSSQTVTSIAHRRTYKHIDGPDPAPKRHRASSGYWGVTANGFGNRFYVNVYHGGVTHRLGTFYDAESAARAYDAKVRELGMPAERLNFPNELIGIGDR